MKECTKCKSHKPHDNFYPKKSHCKPCHNEQVMAWRRANPEKIKSIGDRWRANNRERKLATAKAYRERPERRAAVRAHNLSRIAREKNAEGRFTPADIAALMDAQAGCCNVCQCDIRIKYHIDHIVALVKGGSNWPSNLQLLCPPCNMRKGAT